MDEKTYFVYIITNKYNTTLYTGVTNNLYRRVLEHKSGIGSMFCKRYNLTKLVFYEFSRDIRSAIWREKQIKGGSRNNKIEMINLMNPDLIDLFDDL